MSIIIGKPLIAALRVAYAANQPVLLMGKTGVGKSQVVEATCKEIGIGYMVRDLSIMEPSDLVGMPKIENGRTHFAPPAFLPADESSKGILMFEELNRAPQYMLAPTLELLTSRRLNDYKLPKGWLPMAAINPSDDENYIGTRQLDAALLARFMKITAEASVKEWIAWAKAHGVHADVVDFVLKTPNVFDSIESNPRAWTAVSATLAELDVQAATKDTAMNCIAGLVGDIMASAFLSYRKRGSGSLVVAEDILNNYGKCRDEVKSLIERKDTAILHALVQQVLCLFQDPCNRSDPKVEKAWNKNIKAFEADLQGDFKRLVAEAMEAEAA